MKTSGYKVGRKNNWRRWIWNRICERLDVPVRDAIGLYLPAEEDLDRVVARGKGFRDQNLIGVDLCEEAVAGVKGGKNPGIKGKIEDVVLAWSDPKLDFIYADFCCGFGGSSHEFAESLFHSNGIKDGAVIVVNLLRGRDGGDWLSDWKGVLGENEEGADEYIRELSCSDVGNMILHRGFAFFCFITTQIGFAYDIEVNSLSDMTVEAVEFSESLVSQMSPILNSYRSGNLIMDSVVFRWPIVRTERTAVNLPTLTRQLGALKAVRTMRMAGNG